MAKEKSIHLVVITPERQVLDETADAVVIPAHDGELGVLRDRAPLVCELGVGQLRYSRAAQAERLFVDGGFAQVLDNQVTVLTSQAIPAQQISPAVLADAERASREATGRTLDAQCARERAQRRASVLRRLRIR
jgi:F-type H+-transporting ATPase subunit epsilon